ncbi:hypothetical protein RI844_08300 [Thalassotalea fonticola]|uniref:Uncharacterized protein n=1 Tax=Thalassotalea fonticola TaxID=3065649 RepID=A0ABZ0GTW5_9GAMM|nr:hypothetical protein RI844_08300 [Colwelliaceae bacterium S1-1]
MKFTFLLLALIAMSLPAYGYVGPGSGLSAIGTVIAFLGAIILMFFGLLWYPMKKIYRRIKGTPEEETEKNKLKQET